MERDEKWGIVWAHLMVLCERAYGSRRFAENNERNFSISPARVTRYLYENLQPACLEKWISCSGVLSAIADMNMQDYNNEPLGPLYIHAAAEEYSRLSSRSNGCAAT